MRRVDHVELDRKIVVDEIRAVRVVREDAADLRRGQEDVLGLLALEECAHGGAIEQVQLGARAQQ